jgi:hypothetical protein
MGVAVKRGSLANAGKKFGEGRMCARGPLKVDGAAGRGGPPGRYSSEEVDAGWRRLAAAERD